MAMKIVLIAALCISQGFAFRPIFGKERGPCKTPAAESVEAIPHEFEEAVDEIDDVRETVSAAIMESYFKETDPKVIIACYRLIRGDYVKLGQDVANQFKNGVLELAEILGEKYEAFAEKAAAPVRIISDTLRTLPQRIWENIKNKDFVQALEVYRESRRIVEENARILAEITREFAGEFPAIGERAEEIAQEIRENARNGCQAIQNAFRKCVEEGGPKTPFEEEEVENEVVAEDSQ